MTCFSPFVALTRQEADKPSAVREEIRRVLCPQFSINRARLKRLQALGLRSAGSVMLRHPATVVFALLRFARHARPKLSKEEHGLAKSDVAARTADSPPQVRTNRQSITQFIDVGRRDLDNYELPDWTYRRIGSGLDLIRRFRQVSLWGCRRARPIFAAWLESRLTNLD